MSLQLIARSADLQKLQNEGYDIEIRGGYLLVKDVPYVDSNRTVQRGTLISALQLAGDRTTKPTDHVAYWTGDHPCHNDGRKIRAIENPSPAQTLCDGARADFTFSAKADYRDYHHKMTSYMARISGEATVVDPNADARTYPTIAAEDARSPFKYIDTASSRAGIVTINNKIAGQKVGIVGLGGTGSYVLDLLAKTAVAEIRLFDGDVFSQHNAFRAPGAPTLEELEEKRTKANHFARIYGNMHNGIVVHDIFLDETNVNLIDGLDFVFLCIDRGQAKQIIVGRLNENGTSFIDAGLGVVISDEQLGGIVRVTTSTKETQVHAEKHISYSDGNDGGNEYASNIQIAELNALNAAMAIIQWKRLYGIYIDTRNAIYTGYSLPSGEIANEGLE